jgi:hypothetical protein
MAVAEFMPFPSMFRLPPNAPAATLPAPTFVVLDPVGVKAYFIASDKVVLYWFSIVGTRLPSKDAILPVRWDWSCSVFIPFVPLLVNPRLASDRCMAVCSPCVLSLIALMPDDS